MKKFKSDTPNKKTNAPKGALKGKHSKGRANAKTKVMAICMSAIFAMCAFVAGCSSVPGMSAATNANTETPAEQNRAYMTKINQAMTNLETNLTSFTEAVSRGDAISMKTQSDKAMNALDEVKSVEAPDALKDVKTKYDSGIDNLKSALSQYVDLYTSGAEITQDSIAPIQQLYDAGVASLKEADESVASLS